MPKLKSAVKKRKQPITSAASSSKVSASGTNSSSSNSNSGTKSKKVKGSSALATRTTIRRFHLLLKKQAQLKSLLATLPPPATSALKGKGKQKEVQAHSVHDEKVAELDEIEKEMVELGGLEWYQRASKLGQSKDRGGDSSHVLVSWLRSKEVFDPPYPRAGQPPLKLLEIGALRSDNYANQSSWILPTCIDLRSEDPNVTEQDFMERPVPKIEDEKFDVVSCSLVLNFVPTADGRGAMLRRTLSFLHPYSPTSSPSLLFLVLPTPCIVNSRYMSPSYLKSLMVSIGYEEVASRLKVKPSPSTLASSETNESGGKSFKEGKGGKGVAYYLYRNVGGVTGSEHVMFGKRKIIEDGPGKNNFGIVL